MQNRKTAHPIPGPPSRLMAHPSLAQATQVACQGVWHLLRADILTSLFGNLCGVMCGGRTHTCRQAAHAAGDFFSPALLVINSSVWYDL